MIASLIFLFLLLWLRAASPGIHKSRIDTGKHNQDQRSRHNTSDKVIFNRLSFVLICLHLVSWWWICYCSASVSKSFFTQLYTELSCFHLLCGKGQSIELTILYCLTVKECRTVMIAILQNSAETFQWKFSGWNPVKRYSVWRISRVGIFSAKMHSPSPVDPVSPTMCDSRTICPALNINTALLSSDGCALHSVNFKCFVCVLNGDTGNSWLNTAQWIT